MKLIFLCKRRPQGRDLLTRPYGRFYHLPRLLAKNGHDVSILLCSYNREPDLYDVCDRDGIHWYSISLVSHNPFRYYNTAKHLAGKIMPDWIVGFSDIYYGVLAQKLAHRYGCRSLIDAYDNYESYLPWCFPLHLMWRKALAEADMVTAAGPQLAEKMGQKRKDRTACILPMAADLEFLPLDKVKSRRELGLPQHKKLIGYCGAIYRNRGIEFLFQLADRICSTVPDVEIVVSGRKEKGVTLPDNIRWLGYLPDAQMPIVLNCMDVLLVLNRDNSAFGQYSYPVKLYEAIQCGIQVVASNTAPANWILGGDRRCLAKFGDLEEFSSKIIAALDRTKSVCSSQTSWEGVADELEKNLEMYMKVNSGLLLS